MDERNRLRDNTTTTTTAQLGDMKLYNNPKHTLALAHIYCILMNIMSKIFSKIHNKKGKIKELDVSPTHTYGTNTHNNTYVRYMRGEH